MPALEKFTMSKKAPKEQNQKEMKKACVQKKGATKSTPNRYY